MDETKRRAPIERQALRVLQPVLAREGAKIRLARRRRRWTQKQLGVRCALSQQTISQMERGDGATLSHAAWQRAALVLGLTLDLKLGRDKLEDTRDSGHLPIQELLLRLGRTIGLIRRFELQTRPSDPTGWSDVGLVDRANRRLMLFECVNVFGDIGASVRSSDRKASEAEGLAIAMGRGEPYSVHVCWVIRDTRRNRELVARYPEIFGSRFPGSSRAWVNALTAGGAPPAKRGLIWCDLAATRVFPWRHAKSAA
jgi:transcriptional regulator with XRE-family HTH domain